MNWCGCGSLHTMLVWLWQPAHKNWCGCGNLHIKIGAFLACWRLGSGVGSAWDPRQVREGPGRRGCQAMNLVLITLCDTVALFRARAGGDIARAWLGDQLKR